MYEKIRGTKLVMPNIKITMDNLDNKMSIREILERHFKDGCDLEFTIQEGKLWLLNARPMRRTGRANIVITIDLFFEKIIEAFDVIERISIENLIEYIKPTIYNLNKLTELGKGLPAGIGAATGIILFSSSEVLTHKGQDCIICKEEVNPEDIEGIRLAKGILTSRGGMTSHAALISRGWGKPCIVGMGSLRLDANKKTGTINNISLQEGEWVTIDGSRGILYKGKGLVKNLDWRTDRCLTSFARIIEKLICTNTLQTNSIGKAWLIRDHFLHNIPLVLRESSKRNVSPKEYKSFNHPDKAELLSITNMLRKDNSENLRYILQGLRNTLIRLLSQKLGIGNHYKYFRPLLDPMRCLEKTEDTEGVIYKQLIAEEFFNIGKYIPNLIDIFKVRIYLEIETRNESELWFLDYTNLNGESLIQNCNSIVSYHVEINEEPMEHDFLLNLYNVFRKREYFWTWYKDNNTSHEEMLDFLRSYFKKTDITSPLFHCAEDLELLVDNHLTKSGEALI
jgi:phosphohistidine swiveling domain-containing protein